MKKMLVIGSFYAQVKPFLSVQTLNNGIGSQLMHGDSRQSLNCFILSLQHISFYNTCNFGYIFILILIALP